MVHIEEHPSKKCFLASDIRGSTLKRCSNQTPKCEATVVRIFCSKTSYTQTRLVVIEYVFVFYIILPVPDLFPFAEFWAIQSVVLGVFKKSQVQGRNLNGM
jgi:uncharacterized membrane protein YkvA (DUF1232 family)